ncbi:Hypothetical protein CINCED_3A017320 [Cinara cedri]|uniref:Uncharacterized protein n=1 Tax=Cinara cedri TaxID=506608 RepID=A0A5E4MK30_9HEMI|nr:Hypothetical protein CINCED_3A017320 [Cinara cedri]
MTPRYFACDTNLTRAPFIRISGERASGPLTKSASVFSTGKQLVSLPPLEGRNECLIGPGFDLGSGAGLHHDRLVISMVAFSKSSKMRFHKRRPFEISFATTIDLCRITAW